MRIPCVLLIFILNSLFCSFVRCFEPISMATIAVAAGATGYWLFAGGKSAEKSKPFFDNFDIGEYYERCTEKSIRYDIEGLKRDLQTNLFGQHIVNATLIPALRSHANNLHLSQKPLVMSFHGTPGTGKNYVADMIIKNIYKYGDKSKFVHKYRGRIDFPLQSEVDQYRVRLKDEITAAITKCTKSIFVFDEVDKMPSGAFESIASLLDHHSHVNGINFRHAIFIFLSNAGGTEISNALQDLMAKGRYRDQTGIQDFEQVLEAAAYNMQGGLKNASMITSSLIDHFMPFLPLEKLHVEKCVRAEFLRLEKEPKEKDVKYVVDNYVSYHGKFSKYGCKRINKKVAAMAEDW